MKDALLKAMMKDLIAVLGSNNVVKKTFYKRNVQASKSYRYYDINKRAILSDKIVLLRYGKYNLAFATYIEDDGLYSSVSIKESDNSINSSAPIKQELLVSEIQGFIEQGLKSNKLIDAIIKAFIDSDFALLSDANRAEIEAATAKHKEIITQTENKMNVILGDIKAIFDETIETVRKGSINEAEYNRIYSELDELKEVKKLQADLAAATAKLEARAAKIRRSLSVKTENEKYAIKDKVSSKIISTLVMSLPDLSKATSMEVAYTIPEIKTLLRNIIKLKFDEKYAEHRIQFSSYTINDAIHQSNLHAFIDLKKDILRNDLRYC